ncbi:hypothetical protein POM88_032391 [Heracleum sosnowskyi]|uniref:Uncharacterized protein n=1 Tax=Heracleum sosnowskyi TaxID=360622 RepID=A0AAD8I1G6_9APIA|nr:hypothetical protein POM88_032391 [Heracleum sosnowskyi]
MTFGFGLGQDILGILKSTHTVSQMDLLQAPQWVYIYCVVISKYRERLTLAEQGAEKWKLMVVLKKPFRRVYELWSNDMGLGLVVSQFQAMSEEEIDPEAMEGEVFHPLAGIAVIVNQDDVGNAVDGDLEAEMEAHMDGLID